MANISENGIPTDVANKILEFLNSAVTPEDIAGGEPQQGPVIGSNSGDGIQVSDCNIGIVAARRILAKRDGLGGFSNLEELNDIPDFGLDKFYCLVGIMSADFPPAPTPTTATSSLATPAELFKFVSLRKPQRTPNTGDTITVPTDGASVSLYSKLLGLKDDPDAFNKINDEVRSFKTDSRYLASINEYKQKLPGLSELIDDLKWNIDLPEIGIYTEKKALGLMGSTSAKPLDASTPDDSFLLWDNLFASLFSPVKQTLSSFFTHGIATLDLLKKLAETKSDESKNQLVKEKFYARVLIPEWLYKIWYDGNAKQMANSLRQTVKAKKSKADQLGDELLSLRTVHRDLEKLRDQNFRTINEKVNSEEEVNTNNTIANASLLKKPTKLFLVDRFGDLDNISIEKGMRAIESKINSVAFSLAADFPKKIIKIGNSIISSDDFCASMEDRNVCAEINPLSFKWGGSFYSKMYWGDLIVTKQYLKNYDLGEVAHIESVLKGVEKERTHRRLKRTETSEYYETESTTESERETQTTERFEMEKETTKVVNQQMQFDAGVNTSGKYGLVNFEASVGFSYGSSSTQVSSEASSFSKEVTNRALNNVKETVRTAKSITILNEVEETALHKIINTDPTADNFNGVYRWVDKYYLNKVINYGGRLLMEFAIPEPANFYIFRKLLAPLSEDSIIKPTHPRDNSVVPISSFKDVSESNYDYLAANYGISGIYPPPPTTMLFGKALEVGSQENQVEIKIDETILVPEGYKLSKIRITANHESENDVQMSVQIAQRYKIFEKPQNGDQYYYDSDWMWFDDYFQADNNFYSEYRDGAVIPVAIKMWGHDGKANTTRSTVSLNFECKLTTEAMDSWRSEMYDRIMDGYNRQKEEYNDWIAAQSVYNQDLNIEGNNPEINRQIEREELKKRCIEMISGNRLEGFDAATTGIQGGSGFPEILFDEAKREGKTVSYFEQVFDWENMTYLFYPYFYGRKPNWITKKSIEDPDPLFTKFLQAGYAKVILPVKLGMEDYVALQCGYLSWMEDIDPRTTPGVNSEEYQAISDEVKKALAMAESGEDAWVMDYYEQKVPTNLVYIVPNGHDPAEPWPGLPDNRDDVNITSPCELSDEVIPCPPPNEEG